MRGVYTCKGREGKRQDGEGAQAERTNAVVVHWATSCTTRRLNGYRGSLGKPQLGSFHPKGKPVSTIIWRGLLVTQFARVLWRTSQPWDGLTASVNVNR